MNLDREDQALVAKMLEHSLRTADSAYRHTERRDAQKYLAVTRKMLEQLPGLIPSGDRVDAELDMESARMEKAADEGEVVIHNVSELVINDELELAGTASE